MRKSNQSILTIQIFPFVIFIILLSSCAAGSGTGLTGGSVPIGKQSSTLNGLVVDEANLNQPLVNAPVSVTSTSGDTTNARTDANGQFSVEVPISSEYSVIVRPPVGREGEFQERETSILADDETVSFVVPLSRRGSPPETTPATLQIVPDNTTLRVGDQITFQAVVTGQLSIAPVWSVHGSIGRITANGQFTATRAKEGRVRVRAGLLRAEARVTVLD